MVLLPGPAAHGGGSFATRMFKDRGLLFFIIHHAICINTCQRVADVMMNAKKKSRSRGTGGPGRGLRCLFPFFLFAVRRAEPAAKRWRAFAIGRSSAHAPQL